MVSAVEIRQLLKYLHVSVSSYVAILSRENLLSGSIPLEVTKLRELKGLGVSNNMFEGTIHTQFGLMTNLIQLQLFGNGLVGSIPSELASLTGLGDLSLSINSLVGCLFVLGSFGHPMLNLIRYIVPTRPGPFPRSLGVSQPSPY